MPNKRFTSHVYSLITSEGKKGTLSREALEVFGVGINHSAVVIFGEEWSFGGGGGGGPDDTGIFTVAPTTAEGCLFRESIELGKVTITREAFDAIIDKMTPDWKALSYHLMTHNCNCFTYALTGLIYPTLLYKFPSYVNRVALSASTVVPESVVNALMDALHPPCALNPHLVNVIYLDNLDPVPDMKKTRGSVVTTGEKVTTGRGCGCLSKMNDKTAWLAREAHVMMHQREYASSFPDAVKAKDALSDVYSVYVRHIGRWQKARVFIAATGLHIAGSNELQLCLPWSSITTISPALINPPCRNKRILPIFTFPTEDKCDSILLYGTGTYEQEWDDGTKTTEVIENVYYPLVDFSSKGVNFTNSVGVLIESGPRLSATHHAFAAIEVAWRKAPKPDAKQISESVASMRKDPKSSDFRPNHAAPHQPFEEVVD